MALTSLVVQKSDMDAALASPSAHYTGIMTHPTMPHTFILLFLDKDQKPIAHRLISAPDAIRHALNVLAIVDECSLDTFAQLLHLAQAPEGTPS